MSSELSKLIKTHQDKLGLSNRALAEKAGVSRETINRYVRGIHGDVQDETLQALANALGVPIQKLRSAAGVPAGEPKAWEPPSEVNLLNLRERDVIERMIRVLAAAKRKDEHGLQPANSDSSASQSGAQGPQNQEAALPNKSEHPATDDALSALIDDLGGDVLGEDRESG